MTDRPGFWKRNLTGEPTADQFFFDFVFSQFIFAPVGLILWGLITISVTSSLIFFETPSLTDALLNMRVEFRVCAPFMLVFYLAVMVRLLRRPASRILAGLLVAGALFCGAAGIGLIVAEMLRINTHTIHFMAAIIPLPILLMIAFIFLRNGLRTIEACRAKRPDRKAAPVVLLTMVLTFGIPLGTWFAGTAAVNRSIDEIAIGDPEAYDRAVARIENWGIVVGIEPLERACYWNTDLAQHERLKKAYRDITGNDFDEFHNAFNNHDVSD